MGNKIGQVRSTSETTQLVLIFSSAALWGVLWRQDVVGPLTVVGGMFVSVILLHVISLRFGTLLEVFEEGISISQGGEHNSAPYQELRSVAAKHTDHLMNGSYVTSKGEFVFVQEPGRPKLRFECDFRKSGPKGQLLEEMVRRSSEAIQIKLLAQMKSRGLVPWTQSVSLSAEGFHLQRAGASCPEVVPYDQIEELKIIANELRVWKSGDAVVPFFTLKNDTPNFIPLYELFNNLCRSARELARRPSVDETAGDILSCGMVGSSAQ